VVAVAVFTVVTTVHDQHLFRMTLPLHQTARIRALTDPDHTAMILVLVMVVHTAQAQDGTVLVPTQDDTALARTSTAQDRPPS
jgi:hypothetical protein